MMFLGIEIGGTKLQLGLGAGDGVITALWRGTVDAAAGSEGIRKQIEGAIPELLAKANRDRGELQGVGIGFGGPTDDATQTVIKSHQIEGWDGFPLADWVSDSVGVPAVLCNDADVAGLAEALFGAGKGLSPIFYITVGTGIGGGLIIDGKIYRGVGRGAAEIGHYVVVERDDDKADVTTEELASGWAIERFAAKSEIPTQRGRATTEDVVVAAQMGNSHAHRILSIATDAIATAVAQMITLLCPKRVVIGGGVSLMGEELFFRPIRSKVARRVFPPFAGLTDIVPAALGEVVVVHGALALARQKFGG